MMPRQTVGSVHGQNQDAVGGGKLRFILIETVGAHIVRTRVCGI